MSLICIIGVLFLVGCSSKTSVTSGRFNEVVHNHNLIVTDIKEQYDEEDGVKEAYIATYSDAYQVEFYVFENDTVAQGFFEITKF